MGTELLKRQMEKGAEMARLMSAYWSKQARELRRAKRRIAAGDWDEGDLD